jgi:signal transduction histidine kinase
VARTPRLAEGTGAGLGLAIARGIVEAHAGAIEVANVPRGCSFTVRLPSAI